MTILRNAAVALALAGVTAAAHAGVKADAVRTGNFETTSVSGVFVPLNDAGATTLSFNLGSAGKKVLTYSAECNVSGAAGNDSAYLELDIIVNGITVAPSLGSTDAFCTSDGDTNIVDNWTRASITIAIQGIAGNNTVRIVARGNSGAMYLWLGDSALVVYD
jgi:hypothetical protein